MWSMTLNASELRNGSFQPARAGTMIRWPDEETGRNSVRPCTIPITIAWAKVSIYGTSAIAFVAPGVRGEGASEHRSARTSKCGSEERSGQRVHRASGATAGLPDEQWC